MARLSPDDGGGTTDDTTDETSDTTRVEETASEAAEQQESGSAEEAAEETVSDPDPAPAPEPSEPTRTEETQRDAAQQQQDSAAESAAEETASEPTGGRTTDTQQRAVDRQQSGAAEAAAEESISNLGAGAVTEETFQEAVTAQRDTTAEEGAREQGELREVVAGETDLSGEDIQYVERGTDAELYYNEQEDEIRIIQQDTVTGVGLTPEARERVAQRQFDINRDPQRVFSGTEQIPVGYSENDLEFEATDDGVRVQLSEEAVEERLRQRVAGRNENVEPEDVTVERTENGELQASVETQQQGRPTNADPQTFEQRVLDTITFGATRRVRAAENPIEVSAPDTPDVDVETNTDNLFAQAQGEEAGPVVDVDADGFGSGQGALAGAAAGAVAVPEPTSSAGGALVLGGLAAGGVIASSVELNLPEEQQRQGELGIGQETVESEVEPGESVGRTEIQVPEEETVVQPEELGVPQEAVDQGEIDVTGGDVTDDGEIIIPAGTTQVAQQTRYEDEEEEETEEEEEEEVVVEVPEEFIPEEEVVIGEGEEPVDEEVEEPVDEVEEEEEAAPAEEIEVIQGQDTAFPEETEATGDLQDRPADDEVAQGTEPTIDEVLFGETGGGAVAGPAGADFVGVAPVEEEADAVAEAAEPEAMVAATPITGVFEATQAAEIAVQAQTPVLQSLQQGLGLQPAQAQAQGEAVANANAYAFGEGFAQGTGYGDATRPPENPIFGVPEGESGDDLFEFFGGRGDIITDFRDPLTGNVLETDADPGGPDANLPGF